MGEPPKCPPRRGIASYTNSMWPWKPVFKNYVNSIHAFIELYANANLHVSQTLAKTYLLTPDNTW